MQRAAVVMLLSAGQALAHPGHGAPEGHLHSWGIEHAVLFGLVFLFFLFLIKK